MKKCIYCKTQVDDNSVVDVCTRCGIGVWGEKMFAAILDNMQDARDKGDLYQGSVTDPAHNKPQKSNALKSMAHETASQSLPQQRVENSYFDKSKGNSFGSNDS